MAEKFGVGRKLVCLFLQYKQLGISGTMRSIVATEGMGGLYRGILPALLSMAPNGAVFYGVYDCLKMAALRTRHRQRGFSDGGPGDSTEPLEVWQMLLHGAVAGAASEASTYPLDLVRRRLQVRECTRDVKTKRF